MQEAPDADLQSAPEAVMVVQPSALVTSKDLAVISKDLTLTRQLGFASDARAVLLACLQVADTLAIAGAGIASHVARNGSLTLSSPYCAHIAIGCIIFGLTMHIAGLYDFAALRRYRHLTRVSAVWAAVLLIMIAMIYLGKLADEFSRAWILFWAAGGWLGLMGIRLSMARAVRELRARNQLVTHVAVVGQGAAAESCARRLKAEGKGDVEVIGVFTAADVLNADICIDEIVVVAPPPCLVELGSTLNRLNTLAVDIRLSLDFAAAKAADYIPPMLVPVWERPLAGLPTVFKRCMDISVSTFLLALTLPLMALIAALIKLDSPGPVLFKQRRGGSSKKPFTLYKFRSMRHEAGGDPSVLQARRDDPRVTWVGRFLRRTSLDELPQLINVLNGDMSLVGPRPHAIAHDERYATLIDGYLARHRVKPGITGWAQVNGLRGETDTIEKMRQRLKYDLYYIDNWSPLLDFHILCRTLTAVLYQRNAY